MVGFAPAPENNGRIAPSLDWKEDEYILEH
jgi:hypothetical protein